ncbi:uncharacterized protein A1O9_11055 [Exophiala aquamarina CBS 119918]|uniref:Uncharacterized protein n=1 Tax=Exophiala aquamarina CBS 119918 TaxID=1182545 RepID=A0A072NZX1_9EURO|nr:uncharacterized protein A1O9_11055 [Exophiala aquamarina CBS 119918]KEF53146.1 hypothetical protein A1O9_11055 [Exophiala aquamarina CBS 119918]
MCNVYSNTVLNIFADYSSGSHIGLFHQRDVCTAIGFVARANWPRMANSLWHCELSYEETYEDRHLSRKESISVLPPMGGSCRKNYFRLQWPTLDTQTSSGYVIMGLLRKCYSGRNMQFEMTFGITNPSVIRFQSGRLSTPISVSGTRSLVHTIHATLLSTKTS